MTVRPEPLPRSRQTHSRRAPSRRTVLRGAVAVPVAVAVGASISACTDTASERREDAERLVPHAREALRQQRAAQSLAPRNTDYTAALTAVAEQRGQHAKSLSDEINRVNSSSADQIDDAGTPPIGLDALRTALETTTRTSAAAAVGESGYAAGLLASISASCKTMTEVQLA
ncbi:hypothetical protein [Gordonia zhaorongruii]|uniref:hypothetical protein n=1 Tax=Gordonia zhaorongruii TaxID=2597659 RepID=UPI001FCFFBE7|nr:hypothetical protein [Gordonia zhaorongruii]